MRGWAQACLLLLLAGCASTPPQVEAPVAGEEGAVLREVPPRAQTLYEQAIAALAAGDTVDAQLRFEAFVLEFPDFPGAYVNLAIIHAKNGDDRAAEGSLTDALILDPDYAPALNQLGMLLRRQGKFHDAESAYLKAVTAEPDYALAHYNLGVLNELYLQRLDVALQHFEIYQGLNGADEEVEKWITDLKRRLQDNQRTANMTE
ncbi:MAG: tetratricopeptide repeat protein [Gammaproteobacteria bacterium]|nr:tetratricopeptide repeat protein [Gammaproteobacteria bacterium]MDH5308791.1 tetratricopeptide repeat protein [Gammaproteobacteria bacterium]